MGFRANQDKVDMMCRSALPGSSDFWVVSSELCCYQATAASVVCLWLKRQAAKHHQILLNGTKAKFASHLLQTHLKSLVVEKVFPFIGEKKALPEWTELNVNGALHYSGATQGDKEGCWWMTWWRRKSSPSRVRLQQGGREERRGEEREEAWCTAVWMKFTIIHQTAL